MTDQHVDGTQTTPDGSGSGRRRPRSGLVGPFAAGAIGALLVAGALWAVLPRTPTMTPQQVDEAVASALASVTPAPAFSEAVYQAVLPSVVLVEVLDGRDTGPGARPDSFGSGVVVDLEGDILTSLHVVDDAGGIRLTFADGSQSSAHVVSTQPEDDIAVLQADDPPPTLVPATIGGGIAPGSEAYAIGSPFGLSGSLTAGVVSALGRSFEIPAAGRVVHGLIQIDTPVNPGNSGGPLVDRYGRVVGIVTALVNPTDQDFFVGIGLAVPIGTAGGAAGLPPY